MGQLLDSDEQRVPILLVYGITTISSYNDNDSDIIYGITNKDVYAIKG